MEGFMTDASSRSNALQRMLDDLTVARAPLAARRADRHAERLALKRTFYYAIDTNIIYFLGQPITKVISQTKISKEHNYDYGDMRKQVPHIGSIFRTDPLDFHLTIGAALAQYISAVLPGQSPLFLPTSLWPEVDNMLAHFASMDDPATLALADQLFDQLMARTAAGLLEQLGSAVADRERIADALRMLVRQKVGRQSGLERLNGMLKRGKIDSLAARPVRAVLGQSRSLADWQQEQRALEGSLVRQWEEALSAAGKTSSPHRNLDARALTQIQLRNQFAVEQNANERVIYITADAHVLLAAKEVEVNKNLSFAEAYIRHPIAFLNDIGLGFGRASDVRKSGPDGEPASIVDWMDVLLSQSSDLHNRHDRDAAGDIRKGWIELSAIQEGQLFFQLGLEEIERLVHAEFKSGDAAQILRNLQAEAMKREAAAWRRCFDVAIELALRRTPNDHQQPTRSSPPICFEGWQETAAAIEQFKLWGSDGVPTRERYLVVREKLEENFDDRTGYAFYLASAAFFAARNDWEPAAALAAFSRSVATNYVGEQKGANGREANFIEGVARRHLSKSVADLARPAELLGECLRIYKEEQERWPGPMQIVSERFDLEKLDIAQTELLFHWDGGVFGSGFEDSISALLSGYFRLQKSLAPQVDHWIKTSPKDRILGSEGYALIQCEVRTIISSLMLLMIDVLPKAAIPLQEIDDYLDRLALLREETVRLTRIVPLPPSPDSSFLAEIAMIIAEVLADEAKGRKPNRPAMRQARDLLNKPVLKSRILYPFDVRRFDAMRAILKRNLES
jgi:hypothetical protein